MKAIRVHETGGAEKLRYEDVEVPAPGPGEALVRVEACGVNFIDVYFRQGLYPAPLPFTPGMEGAGVIEALGPGTEELGFSVGTRVAWTAGLGAYAQKALVPAARLIPLPPSLASDVAAAAMLQGMTAHYLAVSTCPLAPGDVALVHAGAGGVGLLLTQIAKRRGARVITTVSTEEKAALSREAGADDVILYTKEDFAAAVRRLTDGKGARVVYDSVGKTTFDKSLDCLAPRGMMVLYGQSSGPVPAFDAQVLNKKGSVFLTRPSLGAYTATREELLGRAGDVLGWVVDGSLKLRIGLRLPLEQAAEAHRKLEGRETTGKVLLLP